MSSCQIALLLVTLEKIQFSLMLARSITLYQTVQTVFFSLKILFSVKSSSFSMQLERGRDFRILTVTYLPRFSYALLCLGTITSFYTIELECCLLQDFWTNWSTDREKDERVRIIVFWIMRFRTFCFSVIYQHESTVLWETKKLKTKKKRKKKKTRIQNVRKLFHEISFFYSNFKIELEIKVHLQQKLHRCTTRAPLMPFEWNWTLVALVPFVGFRLWVSYELLIPVYLPLQSCLHLYLHFYSYLYLHSHSHSFL